LGEAEELIVVAGVNEHLVIVFGVLDKPVPRLYRILWKGSIWRRIQFQLYEYSLS
jgi:hypothetical protein